MGLQLFTRYGLTAGEVSQPPAAATLTRGTSGLIFMDLFDDGDVSDWSVIGSQAASLLTTSPRFGSGALRTTTSAGTNGHWVYKDFTGHTGDFVAQYWAKQDGTKTSYMVFHDDRSAATPGTNLGMIALFRDTGNLQVTSGGSLANLSAYSTNTWYKLTHVVDVTNDTADSYVDDDLKQTGLGLRSGIAGVNTVMFGFVSGQGGTRRTDFDNIVIAKGHEVTCSGLPTGYSLRCTGFNGETKTEAESSGTATVDVLLLDWPLIRIEVLDASGNVVVAFDEYSVGGDAFTFTDGAAGDDALAVFLRGDVAPRSLSIVSIAGAYDSTSGKTFFVYLQNPTRDLYASSYDHSTGAIATPVKVGTYPITDSDDHGGPSITIDASGFLHVIWGAHNTDQQHSKSDNARDISAWTTNALHDGTYPSLTVEPATGDLYLLDRLLSGGLDENSGLSISDDGGATWSTPTVLVDTSGFSGTTRFYPYGSVWHDSKLWFAWTVYHGDAGKQLDVHVAYYDPSDGHLYTSSGTDLGTSITSADHASCIIIDSGTDYAPLGSITADANGVYVTANIGSLTDSTIYTAVWNGSSWTTVDTNIPQSNAFTHSLIIPHSGTLYLLVGERDVSGGDDYTKLNLYTSSDGSSWAFSRTVIDMLSAAGIERVKPVIPAGPFVAIAETELEAYVTAARAGIAPSATDVATSLFGILEPW